MQPPLATLGSTRMQKNFLLILLFLSAQAIAQRPATPRIPVTDNYFGMKVTDHYRWMENEQDSSVMKWFETQDAYAESIFDRITGRDALLEEYDALDSLNKDFYWGMRKDGNVNLFLKYTNKDDNTKLIRRVGDNGKDEVVIDFKKMYPNKKMNPAFFEYSPVSKILAFYIMEGDHEAATIYFYDLVNRRFFPEQIKYSYGGFPYKTKFTHDGLGYFYFTVSLVNNKSNWTNTKAMHHQIGTSQEKDKILVSKEKYPDLYPGIDSSYWHEVSADPDFNYLILHSSKSSIDYCFVAPYSELERERIQWKMLTKPSDKYSQPTIRNHVAYLMSKKLLNRELVKCSLKALNHIFFETVVAEDSFKFDNLSATKDFLLLRYTTGITNWLKQYDIKSGKIEITAIRERGIFVPQRISEQGNEIILMHSYWNRPTAIYLYNPASGSFVKSIINDKNQYDGVDDIIVKETEIPGHDGVMIPLSIIYHKNTKLDGTAICLLVGYGAYGAVSNPWFSPERLIYCKRGVVFAVAHVRGGGAKGEPWRLAGFKATKPNTWKDFISCAEWVIKNKYCSSNGLIGEGSSAGGITVGRAITERSDLFAVAINRAGVTNALRYEFSDGGAINSGEFGTLKDSLESRYLYEMDAVHHVKDGVKYPAVLNTAGMTDGRVPVWQPGKFAAALQHASSNNKPILLQVYFKGGHFGETGKTNNVNTANEMAFALWQAGHKDFQLKKD